MFDVMRWTLLALCIGVCLVVDLVVVGRKKNQPSFLQATILSIAWIALGLGFGMGVWFFLGADAGQMYLTGYLLEKSLGLDNLFVFLLVFKFFRIEVRYQHKILFWGVLGAIFLRALFIWGGIAIVTRFQFMMYVLGVFLILTAIKMMLHDNDDANISESRVFRLMKRYLPLTPDFLDGNFLLRQNGRAYATPLLQALVVVEVSDVIFALDSVPAILAVSTDPFIVYSSNVFAVLGLRSLFFAMSGMVDRFHRMDFGIAAAVGFIGVKILIADFYPISDEASLIVIAGLLGGGMIASVIDRRSVTENLK